MTILAYGLAALALYFALAIPAAVLIGRALHRADVERPPRRLLADRTN